jgi:hypothetical protein
MIIVTLSFPKSPGIVDRPNGPTVAVLVHDHCLHAFKVIKDDDAIDANLKANDRAIFLAQDIASL